MCESQNEIYCQTIALTVGFGLGILLLEIGGETDAKISICPTLLCEARK